MSFPTRTIAALAIGLSTTLVLSSCSKDSDSAATGAANGRGPITFAMGKNDTDKLVPVIEKWNDAHPDEKVTLKELSGDAPEQRDTLVQSLQSGSTDYDVMALDVIWTADFAANQWIAPLTGELAVDTSKLLKSTVESATYNGTLYALPQNTNGQLLYRNTELVPQAPGTWAQLAQSCESVKAQSKDCLILQAKQSEGLTVNTADFIEGWGGHVIDDSGAPVVDSPEAKAGIQALVDGYKDGVISKSSLSATEEETNLAFVAGETAYAVNWPYMYTNAQAQNSQVAGKFEVQPLVAKDGTGVSTLGGYNNGININSTKKATALDFMKFIVEEENQAWFADNSFPPVLASIYDDETLVEKYPYLPALKTSLESAKPRPVSPYYPAISKAIQDNTYAALTHGKSVDEATKDMKSAIENAAK
ncbi:ABC transporter substrate-binding protein [Corynebacterium sp. sy017]|uniref:ABC transporter substrate-binding protein n=1 Tax=unclassified Corynebacterium TaxID=2624378 RepID=UPI001185736C|nr:MULTISPECIES: ABC transporter substrate-binding protein [unclassified Corynebacterium]MBP3088716.1 ABC transporter substrate-binding protein [Corynebacterium sp. sy017]TSD92001.1 ABC transporter substrate-binding protein [Corynebacterium sp. SY003]